MFVFKNVLHHSEVKKKFRLQLKWSYCLNNSLQRAVLGQNYHEPMKLLNKTFLSKWWTLRVGVNFAVWELNSVVRCQFFFIQLSAVTC